MNELIQHSKGDKLDDKDEIIYKFNEEGKTVTQYNDNVTKNVIKEVTNITSFLPLHRQRQSYLLDAVYLFCPSARLRTNYQPDFRETLWKGTALAKEEPIKCWSGCKCGHWANIGRQLSP